MLFWTVAMACLAAQACSGPEPAYNPTYSIYATKEACEARLGIATLPAGVTAICVSSDTVTFQEGWGFTANAPIMVNR
jgi:hypothetical protein